MNGLLVIDKPGGMTSRDALNRVQRWFPRRTKIGHTGTLDPLATGVLVVCIGSATRLADFVQAMGKSYQSRIRLGATSSTDDADGTIQIADSAVPPTREAVEAAFGSFIGTIDQLPPAFSALKVGGRRAHDLARRGEEVPLEPRKVTVYAIRVLEYAWPFLDLEIDCGKGTYIRSLARDLGVKLGVGGMVETLRRTRVGPFTAEQAIGIDATIEEARAKLLPMTAAVEGMPQVPIAEAEEKRFRCGQTIDYPNGWLPPEGAGNVAVMNLRGDLIAIAEINRGIRPRIVLASGHE